MRRFTLVTALLGALLPAGHAAAAPTITHGSIASFDGTTIAYTLMHPNAGGDVPVVLMTHGWGQRRDRAVSGHAATLIGEGYAVLTWDQRGFGDSGGVAQVDSPDYEVKDVMRLIDLMATTDGIQLDAPGDPRVGMYGSSYAGAIQLMTASFDQRVDAIAPQIAWNDLPQALRPGAVLKLAWDTALYGSGLATATAEGLDAPQGPETGAYADEIHQSFVEATVDNDWSAETLAWYDAHSTKHYIDAVRAPTLFLQGLNDTIFPVNHAIASNEVISGNGVPTKMVLFCGQLVSTFASHGMRAAPSSCPDGSQGSFVKSELTNWFAKYLRGDAVDTGSPLEFQTQDGFFSSFSGLPTDTVATDGTHAGTIVSAGTGLSHAASTPAINSVQAPFILAPGTIALGIPRAHVRVTATSGDEANLFFRLLAVDPVTGASTVIDDQVAARKVTSLSSGPQEFDVDLNGVAWMVEGQLRLEVSGSSADHTAQRTPSVVEVELSGSLPVDNRFVG